MPSAAEITPQFLILGVIWYIVFLFSTTCHEGAHSLAAKIGETQQAGIAAGLVRLPGNVSSHQTWLQ
jgi:hypothetical protein